MSLRFLKPVDITSAMLISSTRAETDYSAWASGTTYAAAAKCISTSTHRIYESVQGSNTNHNPTTDDGTWWIDIGPTNRWAMFDETVGSVTSQATPLTVVLDPGMISSLALLDVSATSVTVSMLDAPAGSTVYNETYDMTDTAVLLDWYMYFFEAITPRTTLIVDDLPPYSTGRLTVSIAAATTAECGTLAVGDLVTVGDVEYGVKVGIIDYSRKETDAYGITSVVERAYAKRLDCDVVINNTALDYVTKSFAAVRATPVVWIVADGYDSLIVYGWARDWGISIAYYSHSIGNLTIEGLV